MYSVVYKKKIQTDVKSAGTQVTRVMDSSSEWRGSAKEASRNVESVKVSYNGEGEALSLNWGTQSDSQSMKDIPVVIIEVYVYFRALSSQCDRCVKRKVTEIVGEMVV